MDTKLANGNLIENVTIVDQAGNPVTFSGGGSGGGPATIADGADVAEGAKADAAVIDPALPASQIALQKGLLTQLIKFVFRNNNSDGEAASATNDKLGVSSYPRIWDSVGAVWNRITGNSNGLFVQGSVASGAADAGSPVLGGGVTSSLPITTLIAGNRQSFLMELFGGLLVSPKFAGSNRNFTSAANNSDTDTASNLLDCLRVDAYTKYSDATGTNWLRARGDTSGQWSKQPPLALTDRSIAATTTSQQAMAANTLRSKFIMQNISTTGDIWYNFGATAVTNGLGSLKLTPGSIAELQGTNQALNIVASTGTVNATIKEA